MIIIGLSSLKSVLRAVQLYIFFTWRTRSSSLTKVASRPDSSKSVPCQVFWLRPETLNVEGFEGTGILGDSFRRVVDASARTASLVAASSHLPQS
jgi:hypothetical protein